MYTRVHTHECSKINGNKVGSVYSLKNNEKGRVPDCPPDLGNEVEMNPNQGYLRTGDKVKVDAAFNA